MIPIRDENPSGERHVQLLAVVLLNALALPLTTREVVRALGFVPNDLNPYGWLTYQFLHADVLHLAGNMWFLWLFGDNVEARLGRWFLPFYLLGGAAAVTIHAVFYPFSSTPVVGASGAVCAVIGLYTVLWPRARLSCVVIGPGGWIRLSVSALLYSAIYIIIQFREIYGGGQGVAYGAHLGGLIFGIAVALLLPSRSEEDLALSGPSGQEPVGRGSWRSITDAVNGGHGEYAVDLYIRELRRDPYLELPEREQLVIADKLADGGRPHLAKAALEKFLDRHPRSVARARALLLLGHVEEADFLDFEAAAASYRRSILEPRADDEVRREAQERLKRAQGVLDKTFIAGEDDQELYGILQESASPPSREQMGTIAPELNARMTGELGILARNASRAEAARLAEAFEKARIPVVVIPRGMMLELPPAVSIDGLSSTPDGLIMPRGAIATELGWKDCLLIAVFGLPVAGLVKKEKDASAVDVESASFRLPLIGSARIQIGELSASEEYVDASRLSPCLEVVSLNPAARYRWRAQDLEGLEPFRRQFYPAVRDAVVNSLMVPVNAGAQAYLSGRIPPSCVFRDFAESDRYMAWQIQLANLKERKLYR